MFGVITDTCCDFLVYVYVLYFMYCIQLSTQSPGMTFCNEPWKAFLERTGIVDTDLWPSDFVSEDATVC